MRPLKRFFRSEAGLAVLAFLAALYVRLLRLTGRWRIEGEERPNALFESKRPFIIAFWHGRLLMMPYSWRHRRHTRALISAHADGRLISGAMHHLGVGVVTGSTKRGGTAALREMIHALKSGTVIAITPDGPRGPRMRASPGIVALSRLAQAPILPLAYSAKPSRLLKSWDRFLVPFPFARGVYLWGEIIEPPEETTNEALENHRLCIEAALVDLTNRADALMQSPSVTPAPPADAQETP